jgi:hypothetical protein
MMKQITIQADTAQLLLTEQFAAPRRHMRSGDPQGQAFRIGEAGCSHQGGKWAVKSSGNRIDMVTA